MPEKTGNITQLLQQWREGSREAENELFARCFLTYGVWRTT